MEDAGLLRLGDSFKGATCLTNAEVTIFLANAKSNYEANDKAVPEAFDQTLAYANRFSQIRHPVANMAAVQGLRKELEAGEWTNDEMETEVKLEQFEIASLINLKPEEHEEAVALIPSLAKRFSESQVEDMIEKINRFSGSIN